MKKELLAPNGKPSNLTAEQYKLVRTPEFKKWFGDWENDPKNASKVVDENGEPLVVYHGTDSNFYIFEINEISKNTGNFGHYGYGFYFSKDLAESKHYGSRIINVFLNIKKPFTATFEEYLKLKELGYEVPDIEDKKIKIDSLLNNYKNDKKTTDFIIDFKKGNSELAWRNLFKQENTEKEKDFYNDLNKLLDYTEFGEEEGIYDYIYDILEEKKIEVQFIKGFEYQPALHYVLDVGNLSQSFTKDIIELGFDGVIYGSEYVAFEPNQIKLADGTNTTFDKNNNDIRFEKGGISDSGTPDYLKFLIG